MIAIYAFLAGIVIAALCHWRVRRRIGRVFRRVA